MFNKFNGSTVYVGDNDTVEKALRKFKKKIEASDLLNEIRNRQHYIKPTTRRKIKRAAAIKRQEREVAKSKLPEKLY
jgi:small subunit ribosomal protein S21